MKTKLLPLIIPIVLSIFGIIYFQMDWIVKTYATESEKLNTTAHEALSRALQAYHQHNQDSLTQDLLQKLTPLVDSVALQYTSDSLIITLENKHDLVLDPEKDIVARLSTNSGNIKINFPSHRHLRTPSEMTAQDITFADRLDTLQRIMNEVIPYFDASCEPFYFTSDSTRIIDEFKTALSAMGINDLSERTQLVFFCGNQVPQNQPQLLGATLIPYKAQGLAGYSYDKRWVGAYFHDQKDRIIGQMIGPSSLSALLILIMICCFTYLINIISKQRRIAEMKENYINNMTHELKTPIATISAAIEGMQKFNVLTDKKKTQQYLNTSRSELSRLSNMVTKILNISIYDRNEIEMTIQQVSVSELISDIIDTEKLKYTKAITFDLDIPTDLPPINVDPTHFRNVLTNLLDNAAKYSNETVEIKISCYQQQDSIHINIQDNGIGIASSDIDKVFDKFYRVSTGNIHTVKGYGLGLYYVKYIIERHGGSIAVKSKINRGTAFTISIPLK